MRRVDIIGTRGVMRMPEHAAASSVPCLMQQSQHTDPVVQVRTWCMYISGYRSQLIKSRYSTLSMSILPINVQIH